MRDAEIKRQGSLVPFGYVGALARGEHCLIDADKVATHTPDAASVANPLELLLELDFDSFAALILSGKSKTGRSGRSL